MPHLSERDYSNEDAMEEDNEVRDYLVRRLEGQDDGNAMTPPWASLKMGSTDESYIISTATNRLFTDAAVLGETVMLSLIHVERRGLGLGTQVMEALAEFAQERGLAVQVYGVTNNAFFDAFEWLDDDYHSTFGPQYG